MRVVCGFLSDVLLFAGFNYTNYSKALCIFFTNTLMIPFFAKCIVKEKLLKWDIFGIFVGFLGMILVIHPY
jgi:drug/metabolite transporter (DMT)-like permease